MVGRSANGQIPYALTVLHGTHNGQTLSLAFPRPYALPTTTTVTLYHNPAAAVSLVFPQAPATAALRGTALVAGAGGTYLRLVAGQVSVVVGGGGLIVDRGLVDAPNLERNYQRFFLQRGDTLSFRLNSAAPGRPQRFPVPEIVSNGIVWWDVVNGVTTTLTVNALQGRFVLASNPQYCSRCTPTGFYQVPGGAAAVMVASLQGTGGGGAYQYRKVGGELSLGFY